MKLLPRIINVICDAALVFGYAEERRVFDAPMMRDVLAELETTGVLPRIEGVSEPAAPSATPAAAPALPTAATPAAEPVVTRAATLPAVQPAASVIAPAASVMLPAAPAIAPATPMTPPRESAAAPRPAAPAARTIPRTHLSDAAQLELQERERRILQRERELAEQRRVLAEEYRLLRARRDAAARSAPVRPPVRIGASDGRVRVHVGSAHRYDTSNAEGFWNRLKRIMLGVSPS